MAAVPTPDPANAVRSTYRDLDLSALIPCRHGYRGAPIYLISGREWELQSARRLQWAEHRDDGRITWLEMHPSHTDAGRIHWGWTRLLAEGVYARCHGEADSLDAAAAAVIAYEPVPVVIAGVDWLQLDQSHWITVLDGGEATICRHLGGQDAPDNFVWESAIKGGDTLMAVFGGRPLTGRCATLEEAAAAVTSAPATLASAAAAYIAGQESNIVEAFDRGWQLGRADLRGALARISDARSVTQ
ncbi:MAG: hypothetical protein M0006_08240 [Magnetospirillum sp.]|nr:hypothetical protein [Magnetospirillum sp.]